MNSPTPLTAPALDLAVRVGCELVYETSAPTPALVTFKPRQDAYQSIRQESSWRRRNSRTTISTLSIGW